MRRAIVMLLALTLSVALAVAAGCNPIFGVVSRTQGPTWCEEDAQASAAYCDDFDRVPASTTAMETPEAFHGALQITDAAASSPPNSLGVTSFALTDPGSGALVSNLVNFGNMEAPAQGIVAARCQMDVQPTELATAAKAGTIGIAALGGATLPTGGGAGPGPPKFVFVTYDPTAGYGAQLAVVPNQGVPAVPQGTACALFQGDIDKPWVTIEMVTWISSADPRIRHRYCWARDEGPSTGGPSSASTGAVPVCGGTLIATFPIELHAHQLAAR